MLLAFRNDGGGRQLREQINRSYFIEVIGEKRAPRL
jgi:hypothetical protein